MIRVGVEGRTSVAFCGGLTGRRVAPADPIRRRSGRDWNDDMGRDGCPRALNLRGVVGRGDRRAVASAVRHGRGRAGGRLAGWVAGAGRCCYEAGPTGFGLYRAAVAAGIDCQVIAPSKTPRPSGDRNKSDRRDTDLLLGQLMAGGLTAVVVFVGDVRGRSGSGAGARAGQSRSDALPAAALEAAVAPRPRVGAAARGRRRTASGSQHRPSSRSTASWRSSTTSPRATG